MLGADAADGDLGLGEAFAPVWPEAPVAQARLGGVERAIGSIGEFACQAELRRERVGKPVRQRAGEQAAQRGAGFGTLGIAQPAAGEVGEKVDARPPRHSASKRRLAGSRDRLDPDG